MLGSHMTFRPTCWDLRGLGPHPRLTPTSHWHLRFFGQYIIVPFIKSGHRSNQTSISSSRTWSSVSTAAQLGRSIKVGGSQSNLHNQRNAALKTPWRSQGVAKIISERQKMTSWWFALWLHQTASLSKWLSEGDEKCAPSVLSPSRSSSAWKTTSYS